MHKSSFIFLFLLLSSPSFSQVKNVWALGDGEKVFRNDNTHPERKGNLVWDGERIRLKGLYNEVLAFQVIAETDLKGAQGIDVSVEAPIEKKSGKVIGGNT